MSASLVGSEMCIRDRVLRAAAPMPVASITRRETSCALRRGMFARLPDMVGIWTGRRPRWRSTLCVRLRASWEVR
eukprot:4507140-Alexandrium_andersonii.AAC.1